MCNINTDRIDEFARDSVCVPKDLTTLLESAGIGFHGYKNFVPIEVAGDGKCLWNSIEFLYNGKYEGKNMHLYI